MSSTSGSFLLDKSTIRSDAPLAEPVLEDVVSTLLPEPDWALLSEPDDEKQSKEALKHVNLKLKESLTYAKLQMHARDLVIEGNHAQLTYQNLYLQKLNHALHKKEDRPERGEKVTFDKGGTVFTSDDFVEQLE